jgi:hypothetical protein
LLCRSLLGKPRDPVFVGGYDANTKLLQRLGEQGLKRSIHYHLFRHSSTTYFATKLKRQELCYRYGWKFSSNMPAVYISRAGKENKGVDEKNRQTELGVVTSDLADVKQAAKIKDERIALLEGKLGLVVEQIALLTQALALNPSSAETNQALERRQSRWHPK